MNLPVATRAAHGIRLENEQGRLARAGDYRAMTDAEWARRAEAIDAECIERDAEWWCCQ